MGELCTQCFNTERSEQTKVLFHIDSSQYVDLFMTKTDLVCCLFKTLPSTYHKTVL